MPRSSDLPAVAKVLQYGFRGDGAPQQNPTNLNSVMEKPMSMTFREALFHESAAKGGFVDAIGGLTTIVLGVLEPERKLS